MFGPDGAMFAQAEEALRTVWCRIGDLPWAAAKRRRWNALPTRGGAAGHDLLWIRHAFLATVAACIAGSLAGADDGDPTGLLSGDALAAVGVRGGASPAVFDWVAAEPAGAALVRRIMATVRRFRFAEVEADILKALYESLIGRDARHGSGEYYTPDWLAAKVVRHAVDDPLEQRVLDPACGSGTFLFHAVRRFAHAAARAGVARCDIAGEACARIVGLDVHPVAVIAARATVLLALAPVLAGRRGALSIRIDRADALEEGDGAAGGIAADVLVGNPPWVAYRHLAGPLRGRFKDLARAEGVYVGGRFATQNDLCALFAVRTARLHLRRGGRLGLVLPLAVLTRGQFAPLRTGSFPALRLAWDAAWTLDETVHPLFPVPSCVLFGRRGDEAAAVPAAVRSYSGALPAPDVPEPVADRLLSVREGAAAPHAGRIAGGSPYRTVFRNGATLYPRALCFVERVPAGRLGVEAAAAPLVRSRRTPQEKEPWKSASGLEGPVEAEFLRPALLGSSIVPFRACAGLEAVVPILDGRALSADDAANRGLAHLSRRLRRAEALWTAHGGSTLTFAGQVDHYGKLTAQFPLAPLRVVYAKAGTLPAACLLRDDPAVIDHKLYWAPVATEAEGLYLVAILNSETARARTAAFQSRGQFGARDFDKVTFTLPIPRFDAADPLHGHLAEAAGRAEAIAAAVVIPEGVPFQRARRLVREALAGSGVASEIDGLVARLLDRT